MSKKVAFMRLTETGMRQFDEDGNMIVDVSDPPPYKPSYDLEISGTKSPFTAVIYFDIHTELARFTSKSVLRAQLKAISKIYLHKYIWRYFR